MTIEEIKHQIQIKESKSKILKKLEIQAAGYGMACPAHIQVDIENLKKEIEAIERETLIIVHFEEILIEQNAERENQYGIIIYIPFRINNRKGIPCDIALKFYSDDGSIYYSLDENYRTNRGQLIVSTSLVPTYKNSIYKDFNMFVPYSAIHDSPGYYDIYFNVEIYDPVTDSIAETSSKMNFAYLIEPPEEAQSYPSTSDSSAGGFIFAGFAVLFLLFVVSQCSNNQSNSQVSSSATNSPVVTQQPTPIPISAEQFIRDYFAMINTKQYNRSWSMLSKEFKELGKYYGNKNIENYSKYWETIDRVVIENVDIQLEGFEDASALLELRYQQKDGIVLSESIYIDLVKDNPNNSWLIRQFRSK
jgi:hypothetical protein